ALRKIGELPGIAVDLKDRSGDLFKQKRPNQIAGEASEDGGDRADERKPPCLRLVGEHHRDQQRVRWDGKERTFREGDGTKRQFGMWLGRQAHRSVVERLKHSHPFRICVADRYLERTGPMANHWREEKTK